MKFATDRKRALGMGSGRDGTQHHWQMLVSSMAVVVVTPIFVILFLAVFGRDHSDVVSFFEQPVVAILASLSLIVLIRHFMNEALEAVEDYVHGLAGKLMLVGVRALSYVLIAVGLFALARMAL